MFYFLIQIVITLGVYLQSFCFTVQQAPMAIFQGNIVPIIMLWTLNGACTYYCEVSIKYDYCRGLNIILSA